MSPREVHLPSPDAHLRGTRAVLAHFPAHPRRAAILRALVRPLPPTGQGLKYDLYRTAGAAWGFTVNDRWERAALDGVLATLTAGLPYDVAAVERVRAQVDPGAVTTLGVGVDHPDAPPRLKVYFQEDRWGQGVAATAGFGVPAARARADVVCVELLADGSTGLKLYYGGPDPVAAAGSAPVADHVAALASACPSPGWWYLTERHRPGRPIRHSVNKIYDWVRLGFTDDLAALAAAWAEIDALFGGRPPALPRIDGVRLVPTACARDDDGADVYFGAWDLTADPPR